MIWLWNNEGQDKGGVTEKERMDKWQIANAKFVRSIAKYLG